MLRDIQRGGTAACTTQLRCVRRRSNKEHGISLNQFLVSVNCVTFLRSRHTEYKVARDISFFFAVRRHHFPFLLEIITRERSEGNGEIPEFNWEMQFLDTIVFYSLYHRTKIITSNSCSSTNHKIYKCIYECIYLYFLWTNPVLFLNLSAYFFFVSLISRSN